MYKKFILITLSLVLLAARNACGEEIGIILTGKILNMWQGVSRGIQRAAEELHVQVVIRSPADGNSLDTQHNIQLDLLNYMERRGVTGIIMAPEPLKNVESPIKLTLPLVLIDRHSADYHALALVSTDNYLAGRTAALSLVPVLSKGAKVGILRLAPEISSTTERENGFLSVARERGWKIVIDTYVGYRFRETQLLIDKTLNSYTEHIDAVFAPAETVAYGAIHVVEAMPADIRPRLVAVDWRPEFMNAIRHGILYASVLQDPYHMGYLATQILVQTIRGNPPQKSKQFTGVFTVTQKNIDSAPAREAISGYVQ